MAPPEDSPLGRLRATFPRPGRVDWIGLRPDRGAPVEVVDHVEAEVGSGLRGDRWTPRRGGQGTRQVTLVQAEHLPVVAALVGRDAVDPALLRRNLVVSGINLTALVGAQIRVGATVLELTGPCTPCSKMEAALGPGGYNALRGHGGWNARVLRGGAIAVGDEVCPTA
ncbi:MOSC domain-containing protein [Iamia sp. SCSIO 61187]|uniref:MOSC domain-containing protein n=1 Tax=Iamia sp. SCSIO 61187 TaxID=2722752 RepID=UPI00351D78F9|nr:MOSC domain-containing protein [Iamia sp. SCSIO 61187]